MCVYIWYIFDNYILHIPRNCTVRYFAWTVFFYRLRSMQLTNSCLYPPWLRPLINDACRDCGVRLTYDYSKLRQSIDIYCYMYRYNTDIIKPYPERFIINDGRHILSGSDVIMIRGRLRKDGMHLWVCDSYKYQHTTLRETTISQYIQLRISINILLLMPSLITLSTPFTIIIQSLSVRKSLT